MLGVSLQFFYGFMVFTVNYKVTLLNMFKVYGSTFIWDHSHDNRMLIKIYIKTIFKLEKSKPQHLFKPTV